MAFSVAYISGSFLYTADDFMKFLASMAGVPRICSLDFTLPGTPACAPILISEFDKGNDLILRGATAVILIHTPSESRFGCQDANLAYQNGSLMAESLGVAQFYTGFVCSAVEQDRNRRLAKMLGISGKIRAGMALGIPAFRYPNYIDRKDINVTKL